MNTKIINRPFDIIGEEAKNVFLQFNAPCADDMVTALNARIIKRASGDTLYVPTDAAQNAKHRQALIRQKFTGNNHRELAREYGLSPRQVRNIAASPKISKA